MKFTNVWFQGETSSMKLKNYLIISGIWTAYACHCGAPFAERLTWDGRMDGRLIPLRTSMRFWVVWTSCEWLFFVFFWYIPSRPFLNETTCLESKLPLYLSLGKLLYFLNPELRGFWLNSLTKNPPCKGPTGDNLPILSCGHGHFPSDQGQSKTFCKEPQFQGESDIKLSTHVWNMMWMVAQHLWCWWWWWWWFMMMMMMIMVMVMMQ